MPTLMPQAPTALCCPRCTGPMYRAADNGLDYVCLLCGEYRFLVPRQPLMTAALRADLAAPRRRQRRA